jgi:predicted transcriptional regulator
MIYPQEIEVWYILPSIRKELAKSLVNQGLTQKEISKKLGITESAVSQYLKQKRANEIIFDDKINKSIERAAKKIMTNGNVMKEIEKINNIMRKNKFICKIHHKYDDSLPKNCDICIYEK